MWNVLFFQRTLLFHRRRELSSAPLSIVATDASEACIQSNRERDKELTRSCSSSSKERFQYQVLNVVDPTIDDKIHHRNKYGIVLDKACLDTLLYRSKQQAEATLMRELLNNVHSWLADDGLYIVITPRRKVRWLRDFRGFRHVERHKLNEAEPGLLDGKLASSNVSATMFMFVCQGNNEYRHNGTGDDNTCFRNTTLTQPSEDSLCGGCGLTFADLRNGEDIQGKGSKYWTRRWRGHCRHCT